MAKLRDYTVVRTVREVYKVQAHTRAEASAVAARDGNPVDVHTVSEYVTWDKPPQLPPGYVAISIEFKNPHE